MTPCTGDSCMPRDLTSRDFHGLRWQEAFIMDFWFTSRHGSTTHIRHNNNNNLIIIIFNWHKYRSSTSWLNSVLQCTVSLRLSQLWLYALYSARYKCMGWNRAHSQLKLKQNMYNEKKRKIEKMKSTELRKLAREKCQIICHDEDICGLVQDCSNSSALAMESLQPHTEPSMQWLPQWLLLCKFTLSLINRYHNETL